MSDITDEIVGSLSIMPEGTIDLTEQTLVPLGYVTVPTLMAMYVSPGVAGAGSVGSAKTAGFLAPSGFADTSDVGTVAVSADMNPDGFDATVPPAMPGPANYYDLSDRPLLSLAVATPASGAGVPALTATVAPAGIASTTSVGKPRTVADTDVTERTVFAIGLTVAPTLSAMYADGVASAATIGTASVIPQLDPSSVVGSDTVGTPTARPASILPTGIPGASVFGTAATSTTVTATGINAASGVVGQPRGALVMSPAGFAGTTSFGTAATSVTVLIVPGAIDPSDGFGDPVASKFGWVFRPPVNTYKWRLFKEYEGISLIKENGVWTEVAHPDLERTLSAQKYLPGGHDHVVSTSLKDELIGAGYTVTSEVVTTEEYL